MQLVILKLMLTVPHTQVKHVFVCISVKMPTPCASQLIRYEIESTTMSRGLGAYKIFTCLTSYALQIFLMKSHQVTPLSSLHCFTLDSKPILDRDS